MSYIFSNNASATLASALQTGETSLTLTPGQGALFPEPDTDESFQLAVVASDGTHEYLTCTERAGDVLTVLRAREGTAEASFAAGSRVELRLTAAVADTFLQKTGGTMSGDLDLAGHLLINAVLQGGAQSAASFAAGRYTALDGGLANAITIPNGGGRPLIGTSTILTVQLLQGMVFMWSGTIPSYLKLCDGTNGTPDLRDRMVIGAGSGHAAGTSGGSWTVNTTSSGGHDHGGNTGWHSLVSGELPGLSVSAPEANTESGSDVQRVHDVSVSYSGTGGGHRHAIGWQGDHQHTVVYKPVYYALAFVMLNLP
jgi:hypothetical protein